MEYIEELKKSFKTRCRFWRKDKYGRSMFEVEDERLEYLYDYCESENIKVSLFKIDGESDECDLNPGTLIMVLSNYNLQTLKGATLNMGVYKGAYRFYAKLNEWEDM